MTTAPKTHDSNETVNAVGIRCSALLADCIELLSVAFVRGDDDLPHPANDAKMWTARMQDAWTQLRASVETLAPGELDKAHIELRAHEYNALHSANAALSRPEPL